MARNGYNNKTKEEEEKEGGRVRVSVSVGLMQVSHGRRFTGLTFLVENKRLRVVCVPSNSTI